jgi:release factor glutamine methyltransferase
MNLLDVLNKTTGYFRDKGIDDPRLNAQMIIADVLKTSRLELYTQFDRPLLETELNALRPLIARRGRREPLQHILGRCGFRNIELICDSRALIPRPDTEQIVDIFAKEIHQADRTLNVCEVGTGSGAIILAMASEYSNHRYTGLDVDPRAMELCRLNMERLDLKAEIDLKVSNLFSAIDVSNQFDVLISNPPYIKTAIINSLEPEVRDFDPRVALDGGESGLNFICKMLDASLAFMRSGAKVLLEIGFDQGREMERMVENHSSFRNCRILKDYAGQDRFAFFERI